MIIDVSPQRPSPDTVVQTGFCTSWFVLFVSPWIGRGKPSDGWSALRSPADGTEWDQGATTWDNDLTVFDPENPWSTAAAPGSGWTEVPKP